MKASRHMLPFIFLLLTACKKEYDLPPIKQAGDGARISIAQLKSRYVPNLGYKFKSDSNLYCVVTADEQSGNLYKEVYVRDGSGAIHVKLKYSGGLYTGDSIRINLKGIVLNEYNGLIQLDSVDLATSVVKLLSGLKPQPLLLTLEQLIANTTATNHLQSQLVRVNDIQFKETDRGQCYADAIGKTAKNLCLLSCSGNSIALRTSGYANFAAELSPTGKGFIIAIASQYGTQEGAMQLLLRTTEDIQLKDVLCSPSSSTTAYLGKDFNDNSISSGGWSQFKISGEIVWTTSNLGVVTSPYARISNFISGANQSCETWLISPAIDLSSANKPVFSFRNAYNYSGPALELYVSTNYNAGSPSTANWTAVPFTLSSGNWNFTDSGKLNLSNFKTANTRIAFRYRGSNSDGSTWELDDLLLKEE